ncbi:DUF2306 domain-containing protein [Spirosoma panaciterrae]|uniref:DUF2306 domain-containing protein n=1 Tax=Spirosoma panaciterrae TaxID=496058 RepID=UPI0003735545|nr:DUF2306 domain-containing protein [Spirosoma panaciterrae]
MTPNTTLRVSGKTRVHYTTKLLTLASTIWFGITTIGLWLFGSYILFFYGKATLTGDFDRWNNVLPHGYVIGDWQGNLVVGIHVLLAAILVIGGPLQFIPFVRQYAPRFHRWLGRLYIVTAIVVSTAGLIMVWTRGAVGDTFQHICISIQAVYCIIFALMSFRYAKARQFNKHKVWSLRLYMVTNGVWFFRVELMFWLLINGGPAGFNPKTFTGPFLTSLALFTYAIPVSLLLLELYFYARQKQNVSLSLFVFTLIILVTVLLALGIVGATMGMWLPRLAD